MSEEIICPYCKSDRVSRKENDWLYCSECDHFFDDEENEDSKEVK